MSKKDKGDVRPKTKEAVPTGLKPKAKRPPPVKDREISDAELKLYKKRFGQP